ncbi:MAG: hypothetical protein ACK44E_04625, partial [Anaerolineales bacterium]
VLSKWYHSMMATKTAYQPFVRPTFTNQRKIAAGKKPSYDWRTVVIDGKIVMEHRQVKTLDEEAILNEARRRAWEVMLRAGLNLGSRWPTI